MQGLGQLQRPAGAGLPREPAAALWDAPQGLGKDAALRGWTEALHRGAGQRRRTEALHRGAAPRCYTGAPPHRARHLRVHGPLPARKRAHRLGRVQHRHALCRQRTHAQQAQHVAEGGMLFSPCKTPPSYPIGPCICRKMKPAGRSPTSEKPSVRPRPADWTCTAGAQRSARLRGPRSLHAGACRGRAHPPGTLVLEPHLDEVWGAPGGLAVGCTRRRRCQGTVVKTPDWRRHATAAAQHRGAELRSAAQRA